MQHSVDVSAYSMDEGPAAPIVRLARRVFSVPTAVVVMDGTATVDAEPLIVRDVRTDAGAVERLARHAAGMVLPGYRSFAAMPLRSLEGDTIGSLWIASLEPMAWDADETRLLGDLAELAAMRFQAGAAAAVQAELLEVAHAEHRRSMLDSMTGVLNRAGISAALESALGAERSEAGVGVVVTDVDRFKSINDTLGHAAGDEVIKAVASRLASTTRDHDAVGRLGGDEFLIVLHGCGTRAAAERIVSRMYERVRTDPVLTRGDETPQEVNITMSLGVAVIPPGAACTPDAAIELADQAMYAAKRGGRDRYSIVEAMGLNAA